MITAPQKSTFASFAQRTWRSALILSTILASSCSTIERVTNSVSEELDPARATTTRAKFTTEPDIRVRVVKGTERVRIDGMSKVVIRPIGSGLPDTVPTPVVVQSGKDGIKAIDARGGTVSWPFATDVEVLTPEDATPTMPSMRARSDQALQVNGTRYPGVIQIRPRWSDSASSMDVVASMGIETYLPGVLQGEMFKTWPRQAFEAQAVASRTYALHERDRARRENRTYDVEANTNDQAYTGGMIVPIAAEAARTTRGQVITYNGGLIRAYYSSTCGGRPASAAYAWPKVAGTEFNNAKPLQGKVRQAPCKDSKWYRWSVTRDDDELSQRIRAWARSNKHDAAGMGRLRTIRVGDRNDAQRPNSYVVVDSGGREFEFAPEQIRQALNQPAGGLPPVTEANRVLSGDFETEVWADKVRLHGRGWGHGVGMCQYCAKAFAEQGMDWPTMIKTFYPGVEVGKMYP